MKNVFGVWLPEHEVHLVEHFAKPGWRYQDRKYSAALRYVKNFRLSVDVGGHCGLWAMQMADDFKRVISFEPIAEHRECWVKNLSGFSNAEVMPYALGETPGRVAMRTASGSSGDSWVDGKGDTEMRTLDSFELRDVDFLKIDCEGYELFVLKGAVETIQRCRPVMVVEQKKGHAGRFGINDTDAVPYLESLGAVLRETISGDYIFTWK